MKKVKRKRKHFGMFEFPAQVTSDGVCVNIYDEFGVLCEKLYGNPLLFSVPHHFGYANREANDYRQGHDPYGF